MLEKYPLVSFCIIAYNEENYISEAIKGALEQEYPNLEIIISDDCSHDRTYEIAKNVVANYYGPHKILLNKNENNLGLVGHCNKIIGELAKGEYIILASGDDVSLPQRTKLSVEKIIETGVDSLALNFEYVNENGEKLNKVANTMNSETRLYNLQNYIKMDSVLPSGPSRIITRRIYDVFGDLQSDCQTEDTTLTFRALLLGGIAFSSEVGVLYRIHSNNMSSLDNICRNIDTNKIYNQYYIDLCVAKNNCLIQESEYTSIKKIIDDYKITQIFIRKLYKENNSFKRYLIGILYLLNPNVIGIHKMKYLKKSVKSCLFRC